MKLIVVLSLLVSAALPLYAGTVSNLDASASQDVVVGGCTRADVLNAQGIGYQVRSCTLGQTFAHQFSCAPSGPCTPTVSTTFMVPLFGDSVTYAGTLPAQSYEFASGNFGAGHVDLLVPDNSTGVSYFKGNGDGTLQAATTLTTGASTTPLAVAVGKLRGVGANLDIVVANRNNTDTAVVSVLLGNGDGTFVAHADYNATGISSPTWVAVRDLNGDGKDDVVLTGNTAFAVFLADAGGSGALGTASVTNDSLSTPLTLIGEFTGNAFPDLLRADFNTPETTYVYPGVGNGTFGSAITTVTTSGFDNPYAIADLNGDGQDDIVGDDTNLITIDTLLSNGDGTFASKISKPISSGAVGGALGDVNGDGLIDFVDAANDNTVRVYLGDGRGHFAHNEDVPVSASINFTQVAPLLDSGQLSIAVSPDSSTLVVVPHNPDLTTKHVCVETSCACAAPGSLGDSPTFGTAQHIAVAGATEPNKLITATTPQMTCGGAPGAGAVCSVLVNPNASGVGGCTNDAGVTVLERTLSVDR